MNQIKLRMWHRRIGFTLSPLIIIQAITGLTLSVPSFYQAQERMHSTLVGRKMPSLASFWKYMLVQGHTGGGVFGIWYNFMLGFGLLTIAFSGIIIFLGGLQMMRDYAKRKNLPDSTGSPVADTHEIQIPKSLQKLQQSWAMNWHIYTMLAVGFFSVIMTAYYTNFLAYRISGRDTLLTITASEIALQTSLAHLEQEEIWDGSRNENEMKAVIARLTKVDNYLMAMVEGGITPFGVLPPPYDSADIEKSKALRRLFRDFKIQTEARRALSSNTTHAVGLVKAYDKTFASFIAQAEETKRSIDSTYLQNVASFRSKFELFLSLNAILLALIFVFILPPRVRNKANY